MSLVFEKVISAESQIEALYELLKGRSYNISHERTPLFEEHCNFVKSHPYCYWYLIKHHNFYVGTLYIKRDNSIGISLISGKEEFFNEVVCFALQNHLPEPEVKSIIPSSFYINVSPKNQMFIDALNHGGAKLVQFTYLLDPLTLHKDLDNV